MKKNTSAKYKYWITVYLWNSYDSKVKEKIFSCITTAVWIFYSLWRKTLRETIPNFSKSLITNCKTQSSFENSGLLTGSWHDVTVLTFGSDWMHFKYNAEGRHFWISLVLRLQSLHFTHNSILHDTCLTSKTMHPALMNKVCNQCILMSTIWLMCLQKWTYTEQNGDCRYWLIFLSYISLCNFLNDFVTNREWKSRNFTIWNKIERAI